MKADIKEWFKAAGIRAVRTVAQTALATIGTAAVLEEVNWLAVASASLLAGILSMLMSLTGLPELDKETETPDNLFAEKIAELEEESEETEDGSDKEE